MADLIQALFPDFSPSDETNLELNKKPGYILYVGRSCTHKSAYNCIMYLCVFSMP